MAKWKGKKVSRKQLFDLKQAAEWREFVKHRRVVTGKDVKFYSNGKLIATADSISSEVVYGE